MFGNHAEVPPPLRFHTVEKLERIAKYARDVRRIDVDYEEYATRRPDDSHVCEILVHVNRHLVKGQAAAADHYAALDLALDKVERQMRRLHERRVRRRSNAKGGRSDVANPTGPAPSVAADHEREPDGPLIVKTKQIALKPMDVEEAALQMELLGHDFFLFTSSDSGRACVLYRRRDGQLGLIEASG